MGRAGFCGRDRGARIAGFAALASVIFVGGGGFPSRPGPHSIPLVALGTGLLWFGWYGFNAGSELRVDAVTSLAFFEYGYRGVVCGDCVVGD